MVATSPPPPAPVRWWDRWWDRQPHVVRDGLGALLLLPLLNADAVAGIPPLAVAVLLAAAGAVLTLRRARPSPRSPPRPSWSSPPGCWRAAALAALPDGAFGPFSARGWIDIAADHPDSCLGWPATRQTEVERVPRSGPFPDIPVLVLNGDMDLQTTLQDAEAAAAQFPGSVLVPIENGPHGLLLVSTCAQDVAFAFLDSLDLPAADACATQPVALPTATP